MNKFIYLLAVILLLGGSVFAQAPAGTISVTAANVVDSTGTKLVSGTAYFAPVDTKGNKISFHLASGQVLSRPVSTVVTNGAFSTFLADTAHTVPANVCFSVSIIDNASGDDVLGGGYTCVQPSSAASWCTSTVCNFDGYVPNLAPIGITYPATMAVGTVTNTFPGGTAAVINVGSPSNSILNFVLPQGIQGPIGAPTSGVNLTPTASQHIIAPFGVDTDATSFNGVLNAARAVGSDIGAKINTLIAACAGGPCPIYIPAGTYGPYTTPIVMASNVELYGAGSAQTKLLYNGASGTYAINIASSVSYMTVHDFSLTGPVETPSNLTSYNNLSGISMAGNHNTITKMKVAHFWQNGGMIGLGGSFNTISDNDLEYGTYIILGNGTNHIIRHNYVSNHYSQAKAFEPPLNHYWDGIGTESLQNSLIEGNTTIDNATAGIYTGGGGFGNAFGNRIIGNFVKNNWQHGIDTGVTGDVTAGNSVTNTVIADNISIDNAGANIWSICNQGMSITGNFVSYTSEFTTFFGSPPLSSDAGIAIGDICGTAALDVESNVSVTGNTIMSEFPTQGISYNVAKGIGNVVANNSNTGAQFDFINSALDLTKNTYNAQNTLGQNITNPVKITATSNPLTLCFSAGVCSLTSVDGNGAEFHAASLFNFLGPFSVNGGAAISSSTNVMQTSAGASTGTCTLNGFIPVNVNGVTFHLASCQ